MNKEQFWESQPWHWPYCHYYKKQIAERDGENKSLRKLLRERMTVIEGQDAEIQRLNELLDNAQRHAEEWQASYHDAVKVRYERDAEIKRLRGAIRTIRQQYISRHYADMLDTIDAELKLKGGDDD